MSLNESIVEEAAIEWFGEQTRCARTLIPAFSQWEKEEEGEMVLVGRLRKAIQRLHPVIPEEKRAAIKRYLRARFKRRLNP